MIMEYRSWIEVPGLPYSQEADHERLFDVLLRDYVDLGPVMSWTDAGDATLVILSTVARSQSSAVAEMIDAVANALLFSGLGHLDPVASIVEPVREDAAAATA